MEKSQIRNEKGKVAIETRNSKTIEKDYIANLRANAFEDLDEMDDFLWECSLLV